MPVAIFKQINGLPKYNRAHSLHNCPSWVKDIRDKLVIEVYSRQAQNTRQSVGLVKSG
jgi:hypothetical protein